jgi:hypothetical protein
MKLKIAFYKHSKSIFGKLIRFKQWWIYENRYARYSHTELVFQDWLSFSSSEQDNWVRFKQIKFKKANWDFIEIEVSKSKYDKVLKFCRQQEWNRYNWIWIVAWQILHINWKWKNDWFCSEICSRALQEIGMLCPYSSLFIEPAELAELLEENGYKITN